MKLHLKAAVLCMQLIFSVWVAFSQDRVVTIDSARSTEYISSKGADSDVDEVVRFIGAVSISITEGKAKSLISADEVTYNKTRETLQARGAVRYEHSTGGKGSEIFKGEALFFNIATREGVFLDGNIIQDSGRKESDPYIISAEVSGRDSGSTIAFRNAVLTTCEDVNPHWTINASRIWLLPGNEIGILNGVLRIGPLPVLYIPAFYYPSDEMIVHPVFGFRNREGYFVQTTTYLYGRKPLPQKKGAASGTTFADFLQGDVLKEQVREGLFLKNLDTDAAVVKSDYIKLLVDGYSSLGGMAGIDGTLSFQGYLKSISFSAMAGFSETLYKPSSGVFYSTYSLDGMKNQENSWFFETRIPFRYKSNISLKMDKKPFTTSIVIPLVSDPFFKRDFLDRSEDLNWFTLLTDQDKLALGSSLPEETSVSWNVSGSIQPDIQFLKPWINQLSVSSISGLLSINSKTNENLSGQEALYSSERKFFYPELLKYDVSVTISGSLIDSANTNNIRNTASASEVSKNTESNKIDTGFLSNPFNSSNEDSATFSAADSTVKDSNLDTFFPKLAETNPVQASGLERKIDYSLKWSINPSVLQEFKYDSAPWKTPEDIDWNGYASVYTNLKNSGKVSGNANIDSGLLSISSVLQMTSVYQDHPWLSDSVYNTESKKNNVNLTDYKARSMSLSSTNSVSLSPFIHNEVFKPVSVSWNLNNTLVKSVFDNTSSIQSPAWKTEWIDWKKEYVSTHTASATAGFKIGSYLQKLSMSSNLDPLLEAFSFNGSFALPLVSLQMSTRLFEKENASKKWYWDPFSASLTFKFPLGIQCSQNFTYNIEEDKPAQLKTTASWGFFSGFYTISDSLSYVLKEGSGWVAESDSRSFRPANAGFSLSNSSNPLKLASWKNRFQLTSSVSSSFNFNLLKLTESSFNFTPAATFTVFDFLDVKFSSSSRNDSIARYYQNLMNLEVPFPGEQNMLIDLINSFNFLDERARTSSGFKLTTLNLEIIHNLHDWTLNFKTAVKPELDKDSKKYRFEPSISMMVQWKPISDIKTSVKSEKGVFTLNTASDDE